MNAGTCTSISSATDLIALPEDVAVPMGSMDVDKNGNPVVTCYVQFSETVFLIKESLFAAVQVSVPGLCTLSQT